MRDEEQAHEDRVLIERLRLLMRNVGASVITTFLATVLMVWALSNDGNALKLMLWFAAVNLTKLYVAYQTRRALASEISIGQARRLVRVLMGSHAAYAMAWGALIWVTLDTASATESILVFAMLAGVVGGSMSLLSPVLPVFIVFLGVLLVMGASKVWSFGDPAYNALGVAFVLYAVSLAMQGRDSAVAVRAAIDLRFENVELMARLREESTKEQAARLEAVQANLAKSKFLAAASHDLRQPIHALGLFLEVLSRSELNEVQRDVLSRARSVSEASADMLNTLLDFSRIEAGVVDAQIRPFHLQPLLNKIENELAPQADAKGLIYRTRETFATVQSDPALVALILRNLVSNAIRYTRHGGLLIACRKRGGTTRLEVWDTGIGIELSQHREIFREFHQLGNTERDRSKGLGLGLAIADGLARSLGGELVLSSRPGRGSVFRLSLPNAQAAPIDDGPQIVYAPRRRLDRSVLVIDDDAAVREAMTHLLRNWGYRCEAAESIDEALVSARAHRPDIVISDYRLREQRTGAQAIAALRAELGEDLPALLITGDTAPDRLRDAGASGIPLLHKPVAPDQLRSRLVELLDRGVLSA